MTAPVMLGERQAQHAGAEMPSRIADRPCRTKSPAVRDNLHFQKSLDVGNIALSRSGRPLHIQEVPAAVVKHIVIWGALNHTAKRHPGIGPPWSSKGH